ASGSGPRNGTSDCVLPETRACRDLVFLRLERFERLERLELAAPSILLSNFVIYANLSARGGLLCVMSSTINHPSRAAASLLGCHWKTPARITSTSLAIQ